jgi:hypothetical protein
MQDAMRGLDSYDSDSPSRQGPGKVYLFHANFFTEFRAVSFPPSRSPPILSRAQSHTKHHTNDSTHSKPISRHGSENATCEWPGNCHTI